MGTFVTATSTPTIFPDGSKSAAPGISARPGWTTDNYLSATELNSIHDALFDLRTAARGREFHVDNYGAVGDGSTDDTTALQAAITAAEAADGGGVVVLGPKQYLFTALTIAATDNVALVGAGWGHNSSGAGGSVLKHSGTGNGIVVGDTGADRTCDVRLMNFRLQGNGSGTDGDAIRILRVHNMLVDGVRIHGWGGDGIELDRAYANKITRCYINNNTGVGIKANGQNAFTFIEKCAILSNTGNGIHFNTGDCDGTRIIGNDIEGNAIGIEINAGSSSNQSEAILIGWNYFESQTGKNMSLGEDAGTKYLDALTLFCNQIQGSDATTNAVGIGRSRRPSIIGNHFGVSLTVTSDTDLGVCLGNYFSGSATYPTSGWARFDANDGSITRVGGSLPKYEMRSSGWDIKHRIGVNYSGDTFEIGNNITGTSTTQGNLDDTTAAGLLLRIEGSQATLFGASAGSNPRTLTQIARWRPLGGGDELVGVSDAMSGTPGSVTVTTSGVTTNSVILFSRKTAGGTLGHVSVSAISNGTSFTLLSTGNETSTFYWQIVRNP